MWITDRYCKDFKSLTKDQKDAIVAINKGKHEAIKSDQAQVSAIGTTIEAGGSDNRTIASQLTRIEEAIVNGATQASNDNQEEENNTATRAYAGSVGGSLMNRRGNGSRRR